MYRHVVGDDKPPLRQIDRRLVLLRQGEFAEPYFSQRQPMPPRCGHAIPSAELRDLSVSACHRREIHVARGAPAGLAISIATFVVAIGGWNP